jgi:hypothetical protein
VSYNTTMPILCICCELTDSPATGGYTAAELRAMLPAVGDVVAGLGPCLRVAPATWRVETDLAASAAMEHLWQQVFAGPERILVFAVDASAGWRLHSGAGEDPAVEWLGRRLPQ